MNRHRQQAAFTLVELAVVILIIGILTTIAVVNYGAWRENTAKAVLASDLTHAASQLRADNQFANTYPATITEANKGKGVPKSKGTSYVYTYTSSSNTYCLSAFSDQSGVPALHVTSSDSSVRSGACAGHTAP
jgi:prepilin-type N-terminal cleavage/methylation domain-containing protein